MKKNNEKLELTPLAGFVNGTLKANHIKIIKTISTEKVFFNNSTYKYIYCIDKNHQLRKIYKTLKSKLGQEDFIEFKKDYIFICNNVEKIYISHYKKSFIDEIKEALTELFSK